MLRRLWQILGFPLLIAFLLVMSLKLYSNSSIFAQPVLLELEPAVFKSSAIQGKSTNASIVVRNVSEYSLTILGVSQSCGCSSSPGQFPIILSPGDFRSIDFTIIHNQPGRFEAVAHLVVNIPGEVPLLTFDIEVLSSE